VPFYTTKLQGQGLGLGLSISQRIVHSLGGELTAHNVPGGGAEFRIDLERDERCLESE
jgi:two-component system C4-dicarboxylate transport sensor histidine kinase DctB